MTAKYTPNPHGKRPTKVEIEQRAQLIKGFRFESDKEDEFSLISQLASGKGVDEDMGGAYLQHTYPSWTEEDFKELKNLLS